MCTPDSIKEEVEAMPARLRALLEAELAAGNEIVEIGHSFPAPPTGAYFKLARPLLTRESHSEEGFDYRARNSSLCSGEITDSARRYFLIEPALGDGVPGRDARMGGMVVETKPPDSISVPTAARTCFQRSMVIDYEKWHDGVGYDLDALHNMSASDKKWVEDTLLAKGVCDWRDVEALAALGTPAAMTAIKSATNHSDPDVRIAVTRYAPELIAESARADILISRLESATFFAGLGQTLDQVAQFHPPSVIEALLRGALNRPGDVAVHFAAMLYYIHGRSSEPFDMSQRNLFLRFNTEINSEREEAFKELCGKVGVDGTHYFGKQKPLSTNTTAASNADYAVEVDVRGEMLTYCELSRSAHVICTFHPTPRIVTRTLSNWYYPLGRRTEKMSPEEKELILNRIVGYCREHHRMTKLALD